MVLWGWFEPPGSKHFKYPTKWGIFRYCEDDEAVCEEPSRREDLLSGDLRRQSERALQPAAAFRGLRSIVGYANQKSPWSAYLWTRDVTELIESNGASWHLWNGGFGLGNKHVRPYIYGLWKEPSPSAPH